MYATVGRHEWKADSYQQISIAYRKAVDAFKARGGTHPPRCEILNHEGRVIAHVSPTGIVWPGAVMRLGATPLYAPPRVYA